MNNFKGKYGPVIIAEIGGNHEGDFEYAKELTRLAITTKVDYIKFQLYTGDTLVSRIESPVRNQHFKRFELTKEQHLEIAKMVTDAGIGYMASVWDEDMMDWIDDYMPIYKVGSGDLTAYPVLKKIAKKGKPIIVSAGLAREEEVLETVDFLRTVNPIYQGAESLAVLQCTSMYPIAKSDANLSVMKRLKNFTSATVGYSDHTEDMSALKYAYAMGAQILEFHFTDKREGKEFRDHKVSLTPEEVKELIADIEEINTLKGNSEKKPIQIELENEHHISFRRAVYPKIDLKKGTTLTEENLTTLRPMHGIDAKAYYSVIGKTLVRDVKAHEKLNWDYFV
jgi:N-acetylneuraminate synthase/N,N'-diacetyllegionaminate synthase